MAEQRPSPPIVTLTSDFGPGLFVGLMKGVILGICPRARLVDLCHDVAPQDVRAGALCLEQALGIFPPATVHLAVVDPGVGTSRRGIAILALGQYWVGPDNGLFTAILRADPLAQAWNLADPAFFRHPVSQTFHGRDVFAPVAAHLAAGLAPERLGPRLRDPVLLDWPTPFARGDELVGQVLGADRFGNILTNLDRQRLEDFLGGRPALVRLGGLSVAGIGQAYGQAAPGQALALYNSQERLELALNQGDLAAHLGLEPARLFGLEVIVRAHT